MYRLLTCFMFMGFIIYQSDACLDTTPGSPAFLLVGSFSGQSISAFDTKTKQVTLCNFANLNYVRSIAISQEDNWVFVGDSSGVVTRHDIDGQNSLTLTASSEVNYAGSIALDRTNRIVYVADSVYKILHMSYDGANKTSIIPLDETFGMVFSEPLQTIFWADVNEDKVYSWDVASSTKKPLYTLASNAVIRGLRLYGNRIYTADSVLDAISSSNMDGGDKKDLTTWSGTRFYGVAIYTDTVYVADWYKGLLSMPLSGTTLTEVASSIGTASCLDIYAAVCPFADSFVWDSSACTAIGLGQTCTSNTGCQTGYQVTAECWALEGASPVCERVPCTNLDNITNGAWSDASCTTKFRYSDNCIPTCDSGYRGDTISCLANGSTNATGTPGCERVPCTNLDNMTNGAWSDASCTTDFRYSDNCTLTCDSNYEGDTTISCLASGSTDATGTPACQGVPCTNLNDVANGAWNSASCTTDFRYSDACTLTCASGYEGDTTISCLANGTTDATGTPACQAVQCAALPDMSNGTWDSVSCTSDLRYPMKCTFTCADGFALLSTAQSVVNCLATGLADEELWANTTLCQEDSGVAGLGGNVSTLMASLMTTLLIIITL